MIEQIGLNYIVGFIVLVLIIMGYQLDKFSKHSLKHIDRLQTRVDELEKRLGIQTKLDSPQPRPNRRCD